MNEIKKSAVLSALTPAASPVAGVSAGELFLQVLRFAGNQITTGDMKEAIRKALAAQPSAELLAALSDNEALRSDNEAKAASIAELERQAAYADTLYRGQAERDGARIAEIPTCGCHTCSPITFSKMRMILCPTCGNKRCPRANHHDNQCTGSNESGQPGSAYE